MATKLLTQCQTHFPIDVALQLSNTLGYNQAAMAELLPAAAMGIALALNDSKETQHDEH